MTQGFDFYDFMNKLNADIGRNPLGPVQQQVQAAQTPSVGVNGYGYPTQTTPRSGYKKVDLTSRLKPQAARPQIVENVATTGKALGNAGKAGAKLAGRAMPYAGAGIAIGDAARSYQIANQMEQINNLKPGAYPQEAIDYYRNKGNAIAAGIGLGGVAGGVAGSGVFSAPGAAIGAGIGGTLGDWGYQLAQRNNPASQYYITPENLALLKGNKNTIANNNNTGVSPTGVPQGGLSGEPAYDYVDENKLTGGKSINVNGLPAKATVATTGAATPVQAQTAEQVAQSNPQAIIDYINQLQQINQPYIQALTQYYNNYPQMLDQQQRAARYWQGISSLTGNPNWAKMAGYYNPVSNEANRVALVKQIQDAKAADVNAINELMGNMSVAQAMDLSPEAALANKNLLTALTQDRRRLTDWEKAQLYDATRSSIAAQRFANALDVQRLRNEGSLNNTLALLNMYGGGVAPGLNMQGTQQQPYQPLANKPQSQEAALFQQVTGH